MNYSDYDSDGYSSNEDADYVPSDENLSEDDINECEREDPLPEDGSNVPHPHNVNKKEKKSNNIKIRKRKKRVLKVDVKEEDRAEEDRAEEAEPPQEEAGNPTDEEDDDEVRQKKKSDDLWASFLSDVGSRPKDSTTSSKSSTKQEVDSSVLKAAPLSTETKASGPAKVTITKVFDFAGEEVRVNKEVSADSREGKSYLKAQNAKTGESGDNEKTSSASQPTLPGTRYTHLFT